MLFSRIWFMDFDKSIFVPFKLGGWKVQSKIIYLAFESLYLREKRETLKITMGWEKNWQISIFFCEETHHF